MSSIRAMAAQAANQSLEVFEYDPGPLGDEDVEVAVEYCGLCHSDLSMKNNDWGITSYPFVPGHEAIGKVVARGNNAKGVEVGQRVGIGWNAGSCLHCDPCLEGNQHLCQSVQPTIVGHHGAFAERVRAHWIWTMPIPGKLSASEAGPLLCGGITVFAPLMNYGIRPTDRVGVIGIGGLGHLALKFLNAWGCEVTAFTSSQSKHDEARHLGAHHVVSSRDPNAMQQIAGSLDLIINTVNVPLDWDSIIATLAPRGRLHVVGAVLEPIPVKIMDFLLAQRQLSSSPTGSRRTIDEMLRFATQHEILPQVEHFPMSRANDALEHLESGNARYRIVLDNDFA